MDAPPFEYDWIWLADTVVILVTAYIIYRAVKRGK